MSPAGGKHGDLASELNMVIRLFVKQHRLGYVTAAETGYLIATDPLEGDTVRAPDAAFVAAQRLPGGLPDGYIPLAPDLAVEVVSPSDRPDEIEAKISDYLRAGVRLIWYVYPGLNMVRVETPTGGRRLSGADVLDGGDVLPGFSLPASEIFV